jgi:hypothetical protein
MTNITNHRLGFAVVAALAASLVPAAAIAAPPSSEPPSSATAATVQATLMTSEPDVGIGYFSGADETSVRYVVPPGWEIDGPLVRATDDAGERNVAVRFLDVANIYADPCQWTRFDPPVGPTVDDLVAALEQVPAFEVTPPRDVTVDGYDGKYLEFTFDPYDEAACQQGKFGLWDDTGLPNTDGSPHWWAQGPEQTTRVWILDVAGTRLVLEGFYHPDTPADHRAAIDEIISSIEVG